MNIDFVTDHSFVKIELLQKLLTFVTDFTFMIDRILEVLKAKNLSPSQFADEIGVQRSSISHLVSGRNKPSLDFIQKLIRKFPDINPDFILSGVGGMFRSGSQTELDFGEKVEISQESAFEDQPETAKRENLKPARKKIVKDNQTLPGSLPNERNIEKPERIVMFFRDKTYIEYYPSENQ